MNNKKLWLVYWYLLLSVVCGGVAVWLDFEAMRNGVTEDRLWELGLVIFLQICFVVLAHLESQMSDEF